MGVFSTDKNQIKLIYHSNSSLGKQTNGYVNGSNKDILVIDILHTNLTGTQWLEIAQKLDLTISDLINKEHPSFQATYNKQTNLETNDWLKVIKNHPEVVTYPILVHGEKFHLLKSPSDFVKLMV